MRTAKKCNDPWTGINWKLEIPPEADSYDLVLRKAKIVSERMPEKYRNCLQLLADGCSPHFIDLWLGLGEDVIRRIKQMHPASIARIKENILDNLLEASQVMAERLAREAPNLPIDRLAHDMAAVIDKVQLLSGGVTQRTETKRVITQEELQAIFATLPSANAKTIEINQESPNDAN